MLGTLPFFAPVQFTIPIVNLPIHGFGMMVALGLYLGTEMAMSKAKRDGLDPDIINRVVTWMIVGIFVGGHLGHAIFYEPHKIAADPLYLFKVWDGLSSFGGFIVTAFLCWLFFRKENNRVKRENKTRHEEGKALLLPVRASHYGDCVIYGFPMAFGLGRIGCFMAHDHPGKESDFFLSVKGVCKNGWARASQSGDTWTCPEGFTLFDTSCYNLTQACHDLGLYEAIWACSMIGVVYLLDKKARFPGFYLAIIPMVYAPFRVFFDSLRTADTRYAGLTPAQYGAMILFTVGLSVLLIQRKKKPVRTMTAESDAIPYDPIEISQTHTTPETLEK